MSWQTKYKFHSGRSRVGFLTRCRRHVSIDLFVRIKSRKVQAISSKKEKKEYKLTTASHGTWDFFCLIFNGSDQDLLKKISNEVYHYAFCCQWLLLKSRKCKKPNDPKAKPYSTLLINLRILVCQVQLCDFHLYKKKYI